MKTLEEMVQQLPPDMVQEVQDFIEFLLRKRAPQPQPRGKPEFRWAGALSELHDRYSSVALQHQITEWRVAESGEDIESDVLPMFREAYQLMEAFEGRNVTYTLEVQGELFVIENVPARVNLETGEQLFAPETVERLQRIIAQAPEPKRVLRVPVYEYA